MARLKDIKAKISAVKKTRQITKAMNMVAASRLRGAQTAMEQFRPYAVKFAEVLGNLAEKASEESASPLLSPRDTVRHLHVVLFTSDRGLCGGFNVNLTTRARKLVNELKAREVSVSFTNFGKKGRDWTRKNRYAIDEENIGVVGSRFDFSIAADAGRRLIEKFLSGETDEVHVVYSEFVNMARQEPRVFQLLPIPPLETPASEPTDETQPYMAEHICEPSTEELFNDLLPRSVYVQLYRALLETSTSEHAARMTAMDNATKACNDMLENLTLAYNKARQAAITAELMDIVGGAEALKG